MKNVIILFALLILSAYSDGQTVYPQNIILNTLHPTSNTYDFKATQSIKLLNGFSYKATISTFKAMIVPEYANESYNGVTYDPNTTRTLNTSYEPGATKAVADVSATGSSNYSIPIFISPGTAGMVPQINISYNSEIENGLLGVGWNISGISSISRIPMNRFDDNNVLREVSLDDADQFSLDGNRLKRASVLGSIGNIYNTQIETYSKIISHATTANGPTWFEVLTKDGKTIEYGNTDDSRVLVGTTTKIIHWRVNKITDLNGNYVKYIYKNFQGETVIDQIEYTGNSATGLLPYNTLKFSYTVRKDKNILYIAGEPMHQSLLLSNIELKNEGDLVRRYDFKYNFKTYSHLTEVIESTGTGQRYNSTFINWGSFQNPTLSAPTTLNYKYKKQVVGDFDGNGKSDLFLIHEDETACCYKWSLFQHNGSELVETKNGTVTDDIDFHTATVGDINNDGADDIVFYIDESGPINNVSFYSLGTNSSFVLYKIVDIDQEFERILIGDFFGIGQKSVMIITEDGYFKVNIFTYSNNVNGSSGNFAQSPTYTISDEIDMFFVIDINGDGKSELMTFDDDILNSTQLISFESTGLTSRNLMGGNTDLVSNLVTDRVYPCDINGDGKTDLIRVFYDPVYSSGVCNTTIYYMQNLLSNGVDFIDENNISMIDGRALCEDRRYFINDMNGDGKTDILTVSVSKFGNISLKNKAKINLLNGVYKPLYTLDLSYWLDWENYVIEHALNDMGDFNGDGNIDFLMKKSGSDYSDVFYYKTNASEPRYTKEHLVYDIIDGNNKKITFGYCPMSNFGYLGGYSALYSKAVTGYPYTDNTNLHPQVKFQNTMYLVSSMTNTFNNSYVESINYHYEGAVVHRKGKGFLGFQKVQTFNFNSGIESTIFNKIEESKYFVYTGKSISKHLVSNTLLSTNSTTYSIINKNNGGYSTEKTSNIFIDNVNNTTISNDFVYDGFGNLISSVTNKGADVIETHINSYESFGNWGPKNKLTSITTSSIYSGETPYSRVKEFEYDIKGNLTKEIIDPGKSREVQIEHIPNDYGLESTVITSSSDPLVSSRTLHYGYDNKFRFITSSINSLGNTSTYTVDTKMGLSLNTIYPNGTNTSKSYNSFGKIVSEIDLMGKEVKYFYSYHPSYLLKVKTEPQFGAATNNVYYDYAGREVLSEKETGTLLYSTIKEYNSKGQLYRETLPFINNGTKKWTMYTYDNLGRISEVNKLGLSTSYIYTPKSITIVEPSGKTSTKKSNSKGDIIESIDPNNEKLTYAYKSNGKLKQVEVITGNNHIVSFNYDEYGNQTNISDPNSGNINFEFDAYGQLVKEVNPKGTISFKYNKVGDIIEKNNGISKYIYTYNSTGNSLGLLQKIELLNNSNQLLSSKSYTYNNFGQKKTRVDLVNGINYSFSYDYDIEGRMSELIYPSGFGIKYRYDSYDGKMIEIQNKNSLQSIWLYGDNNELGQYTEYFQGANHIKTELGYDNFYNLESINTDNYNIYQASYNIDPITGNMISRSEVITNLFSSTSNIENFTFDNLDRLKSYSVNGSPADIVNYENNGNIRDKSLIGSYTYDPIMINSIVQLTGNTIPLPYLSQNVSYNIFKKPDLITQINDKLEIFYGPDEHRNRTLQYNFVGGSWQLNNEKIFLGEYEEEISLLGTKKYHYIEAPTGLTAIYIDNNGIGQIMNVINDHQGSITGLFDDNGSIVERYSYDPWGRRRNINNWTYNNVSIPQIIYRGFTGHEHLDKFDIINMNSRLYDPMLARMYSNDLLVQDPEYTQSYNRKSYANNNPLKFTDPTGDFSFIPVLIMTAFYSIVNIAQNIERHERDPLFKYNALGVVKDIGVAFTEAVVSEAVSGALFKAQIGGIEGGAISGVATAATKVTADNLTNAILGNKVNGLNFLEELGIASSFGLVSGAITGGIDAAFFKGKNTNIWNGKSKYNSYKAIEGGNGLSSGGENSKDPVIRQRSLSKTIHINKGFEGDLSFTGKSLMYDNSSADIFYDNKFITNVTFGGNINLTIPSSVKNVRITSHGDGIPWVQGIGNGNGVVVKTYSYYRIDGNWRGFNGFLWHHQ